MASNAETKKGHNKYRLAKAITIVAHQLKGPISVTKGYLEVLLSEDLGKLNKEQKQYLENVLESNRQMKALIADFLDVSRVEEKKLELNPKPTRIEKITKEVMADLSRLARARNCTLSLKVSGKLPRLNIDSLKIEQVVANIITNAIEYTPKKGRVEVELKIKGKNVLFSCKDNGIGVPKEEMDKIFSKFHRSEEAMVLITGGSGLGLFISKAIIEGSGGKIWFKSKEGKGSTFYFTLPLK